MAASRLCLSSLKVGNLISWYSSYTSLPSIINKFAKKHQACKYIISRSHSSNTSINFPISGFVTNTTEEEEHIATDILQVVKNQIQNKTHSRLFAVIHLAGVKHKITVDDVVGFSGYFQCEVGERIRLEKVLAVGSSDFTLVGRPLLSRGLVRIDATVLEHTFFHARPLMRWQRRKDYRRLHWFRTPYTMLRINNIAFISNLDEIPEVEEIKDRVIY